MVHVINHSSTHKPLGFQFITKYKQEQLTLLLRQPSTVTKTTIKAIQTEAQLNMQTIGKGQSPTYISSLHKDRPTTIRHAQQLSAILELPNALLMEDNLHLQNYLLIRGCKILMGYESRIKKLIW